MQPTLMFIRHLTYLTVHEDDVFIFGREEWNVEEQGPFIQGCKFLYLSRQFNPGRSHCDIRYDQKNNMIAW